MLYIIRFFKSYLGFPLGITLRVEYRRPQIVTKYVYIGVTMTDYSTTSTTTPGSTPLYTIFPSNDRVQSVDISTRNRGSPRYLTCTYTSRIPLTLLVPPGILSTPG